MTGSPCHPSFPQPESPSVSLWRYMDFPRFEWMAENERLFIPTADNLGDPLEGTTPQAEIDWWDRELANADTEERRKTILHNRSFFAHFAEAFRKNYYVTCWHMNEFENNVMWGLTHGRKRPLQSGRPMATTSNAIFRHSPFWGWSAISIIALNPCLIGRICSSGSCTRKHYTRASVRFVQSSRPTMRRTDWPISMLIISRR